MKDPFKQFQLSSSACEALKWIALASMIADHVNHAFFDRQIEWMMIFGRVAMPVFALVLGYNLARPGADPVKMMTRLLPLALIAQPFHAIILTDGSWIPLNIMFTYIVGIGYTMLIKAKRWLTALVVLAAATFLVDYTFFGVLLLTASWLFFEYRDQRRTTWLAVAMAGLCLLNANWYAVLGLLIVIWAGWWHLPINRNRWVFKMLYPAHLAVLVALKLWLVPEWDIPLPHFKSMWW